MGAVGRRRRRLRHGTGQRAAAVGRDGTAV